MIGDMVTCMKCRGEHQGSHDCIPSMTTEEIYSDDAQLMGLCEMIARELQPFQGALLTPARLAALRLAAQSIVAKLEHEHLEPHLLARFEGMIAEAVKNIFNLGRSAE